MGLGDWILATADVKEANERTGKKVRLGDGRLHYYEPLIFDGNPRFAHGEDEFVWVPNYPKHRPYIAHSTGSRLIFNDSFRARPGELYLGTEREVKPYIVVEPNVKEALKHTINKAWPHWNELLKHDLPWVQLGTSDPITKQIRTENFRDALHILQNAALFVGTDGALHHAAAALGVPAVVIWTGFSSPRHLGYDSHVNIHDGSDPCGTYSGPCPHCLRKAQAIDPAYVLSLVKSEYEKHTRNLST
jgi:hypothetical protein